MFKLLIQKPNRLWVLLAMLLSVFTAPVMANIEIQTWHTKNGAKVMFVQAQELPMLDIEVSFDAGSARDGDFAGLASMTSTLVGMQTSDLNEQQLSEQITNLGAQLSSDVSRDKASLQLRTLTRGQIMPKALQLFSQVLHDSTFSESIFSRELERLKIGLQRQKSQPQMVLNNKLWATLYGDHPYGHPKTGTLESVDKLSLSAVEQFYKDYYVASNALVAMVGNISRAKAEAIAEQLTGALPQGEKPAPLAEVKPASAQTVAIPFQSTQTYYALTQVGIKRGDADYVPLFVGNHLLGGSGFGSLLMEEVREKRGLVYSVYSYFAPMKVQGPFIIGLSTKNASAKEADEVVKQTLKGFLQDFSVEKLQAIKDNLVGGFPLRMDSNAKVLGYLSLIGFYNLPLDYLEWMPAQIQKVTKEQVLEAWQRHVKPENLTTLTVGQS
ncbi:M16 family metallopeptidase [Thiomicrorhabdus sediminis]|uniref:Insulinase family protein n=1 Tax=Thiomicrorhabdus sediminis TaxID=2580412 RepID=A0A4P9K760_9GAMM|nr:pitrilysin family protein [Thiomicrorhabdus sediminis]QCU90915.1 insulinase family protein [Thiomicrorhabdus sediminis]